MIFVLNRDERVETILTNNGSDTCPYYDDLLTEDLYTGAASYTFKVPSNHPDSEHIIIGNFIIRTVNDIPLLFQIMKSDETDGDNETKTIYAESSGLELLNDLVRPNTYMSQSAKQILTIVLNATHWKVGNIEYLGIDNFYFTKHDNVFSTLQYISDKLGGELIFRVKIKNGKVDGRYVDLVKKRGTDTKKRFTYKKDIKSITREISLFPLVTALVGVGRDGIGFKAVSRYKSNGDAFTKPLNYDYVGDPDALQRYGIKGKHVIGYYEYDTTDPVVLLDKTWAELQKRKTPKVTYEMDVALLARLAGIEHEAVSIGDMVYVIDESFSPALYLEARVIKLETSFVDPTKDKCTLGNFKPAKTNITKELRALQSKLLYKENTWDSSLFTWVMYADDEIGTGMTPDPTGKQFIGFALNKVTETPSMIASDYTFSRMTGEGVPGPSGTTYYTWIKYADDASGTGMADLPTGKKYLGLAHNKTTATESSNAADYSWSLIQGPQGPQGLQGSQGIQGPTGPQGQTLYTWVKYATDGSGSNMSDLPDGKTYIGFAYNKTVATESSIATDYTWSLIQGPQGTQGPNGQTLYTWLKYADTPTTGMSDTPIGKTYMGIAYNKTTATESLVYSDYSWSLIKGDQGPSGADGVSSYTHIAYATNSTGTTGFSLTDSLSKTYIGMYVDQTPTASVDPTKYKWSLIKGADGSQGIQGPTGANGLTPFLHIAYATNATGTTGFSTTDPVGKTYIGTYTDYTSADSTDPTKYKWVLTKGNTGNDGVTTYTWIKYADTITGTGMNDSPVGKRYLGLAHNKTTAVESNIATDYAWSPLYDNVTVGGKNLYLDSYLKRVIGYSNSIVTRTESNLDVGSETNLIKVTPIDTTILTIGFIQDVNDRGVRYELGKKYTLTFKARGNVTNFSYTYAMRASAEGGNSGFGTAPVTLNDTTWTTVTLYKDGPFDTSTGYLLIGSTDVAVGKWFEVKEVKLEQGNIATDFTIAPEDLAQDTDDKLENLSVAYTSAIEKSELDITLFVGKEITTAKGDLVSYTDSKITQTESNINLKFTEIDGTIDEHEGSLAEIYTYFNFSEAGLNIGKGDSPLNINISNEQMDFIDNGNVVAYVNGQKMYIDTAEILNSIIVGNHKIEKFNTNITLVKWVGE